MTEKLVLVRKIKHLWFGYRELEISAVSLKEVSKTQLDKLALEFIQKIWARNTDVAGKSIGPVASPRGRHIRVKP